MITQESNIKFITAVINWLSHFPDSPVSSNHQYDFFIQPSMVYAIMNMILDENFRVNIIDGEEIKLGKHLLLDISPAEETDVIFKTVKDYFKSNMMKKSKLYKYLDMLNLVDLYNGDLFALTVLCLIYLEIGMQSYKSSISITVLSLLDEDDQRELKNYLYDDENLAGKNLILNQRLNFLESENLSLKTQLKTKEKELNDIKKNVYLKKRDDDGVLNEYKDYANLKKQETDELQIEVKKLKETNKKLHEQVIQLNDDLNTLNLEEFSASKSKSITLAKIVKPNTSDIKIDKMNYDLLKWEYNLMSEWIFHVKQNQKIR